MRICLWSLMLLLGAAIACGDIVADFESLPDDSVVFFSDANSDWELFGIGGVFSQKNGSDLLGMNGVSGGPPSSQKLMFSWENGLMENQTIADNPNPTPFGMAASGSYEFTLKLGAQESGVLRLFLSTTDTLKLHYNSAWNGMGDVTVDSSENGFVELAFSNGNYADTIQLSAQSAVAAGEAPVFYGVSAQIPEPAVASLIVLFGGGLLFLRRVCI